MSKNKGRLPPFVPLLISTIDSPAWKALSHGAKILYVALRRRVPNGRNRAYISYRQAALEMGSGRTQIGVWFSELQHHGLIVLISYGCLGVDGKGKSPHWRLTELGNTSKASTDGLFEPPGNDFLKWDGNKFRIPSRRGGHCVPSWEPPLSRREGHSNAEVSRREGHIAAAECPAVEAITSLTTIRSPTAETDDLTNYDQIRQALSHYAGEEGQPLSQRKRRKPKQSLTTGRTHGGM